MHIFLCFSILWNIRRKKNLKAQKIKGLHSALHNACSLPYGWGLAKAWHKSFVKNKGGLLMKLFGGNMGGGCGQQRPLDCFEIILLLWILNSFGCGINFDCNTLIILLLLLSLGGGNDDCR
jgi:hypothetical protein